MLLILCAGHHIIHKHGIWRGVDNCAIHIMDGMQPLVLLSWLCAVFLCKRICEGLCGTSPLKTRVGSSVRRSQSQWATGTAWRGRRESFWSRRILSFQEGRQIKTRLQSLWVQMCTESPQNHITKCSLFIGSSKSITSPNYDQMNL